MSGTGVNATQAGDTTEAESDQVGEAGGAGPAVKTAPKTVVTSAGPAPRSRVLAGAGLFVLGFSVLFAIEGVAIGGIGTALQSHAVGRPAYSACC